MTHVALAALAAEFDRLADEGRRLDFWWRDDDAVAATPALDRLLDLSRGARLPLSLAAVPALAEPSLAERVRGEDAVTVLVHGWRHANHAAPGGKKAELGPDRPLPERLDELAAGLAATARTFGADALPVLVPPWNRIAPDLVARLPMLGYRGLSCFGQAGSDAGIRRIDTHLDPVDWHGTRSLAAPEALATMVKRALARGSTTLGLLTHHLMFDERLWSFCGELAALVAEHRALRPAGLAELLAENPIEERACA